MEQNGARLFVGNLSYNATEEELRQAFGRFGTIVEVYAPEKKGFAFVTMGSPAEAQAAIAGLNNTDHMGRTIKVDLARPPKPRTGGFGGGGGSRGGYGGGSNY